MVRPRTPPRTRPLRRAAVLLLASLTGCHADLLNPAGPVARAEHTILIDSLAIMLAIVIPTIIATLCFAWWFRAGNTHARYDPDWAYSGSIELVTWGIPLLTIMLLGGVAWIGAHQLDPARPLDSPHPTLEVQGVALDWKWLFIYPAQHIATLNQLVVPAGVPIHFSLTSASVLNAFFIPRLGSMIYTMSGMTSQLNLSADQPGSFRGISAHYSGDGFSDMHFEMRALPPDAFARWVQSTSSTGPTLDAQAYRALERQSIADPPATYRAADPTLYQQIVMQHLPPGPGPSPAPSAHAGTAGH